MFLVLRVDAQRPAVAAARRSGFRGISDLGLAAVVADDGPRARVRAVEGDCGVDGRALAGPAGASWSSSRLPGPADALPGLENGDVWLISQTNAIGASWTRPQPSEPILLRLNGGIIGPLFLPFRTIRPPARRHVGDADVPAILGRRHEVVDVDPVLACMTSGALRRRGSASR